MKDKIINLLHELVQLDIDAVSAYEKALEQINNKNIYQDIDNFRKDHIHHIDKLRAMINQLGGRVSKKTEDFKGFIMEEFTVIRSLTGTMGALNAMECNEKITN